MCAHVLTYLICAWTSTFASWRLLMIVGWAPTHRTEVLHEWSCDDLWSCSWRSMIASHKLTRQHVYVKGILRTAHRLIITVRVFEGRWEDLHTFQLFCSLKRQIISSFIRPLLRHGILAMNPLTVWRTKKAASAVPLWARSGEHVQALGQQLYDKQL